METVLGLLIAAFVVYFFAHAWLIRPLIEASERSFGRQWFPFIDRIGSRGRMSAFEEAYWREAAERKAQRDRSGG